MPDLGKQVGPLPLGAWVAVVGGSLGFMFYSRSRASRDAPIEVAAGPDLGVGLGGMGAVGAYTPTTGMLDTPAAPAATIEDNQSWGRAAFNFLVGNGSDGATTDRAIRNYLSGVALSQQENSLITQALARFGQTPERLNSAPQLPGTVSTPTSNRAWLSQAITTWVNEGGRAGDIQATLTSWLKGENLFEGQLGGVNWAIRRFGAPPDGTQGVSHLIATGAPTPIAAPVPVKTAVGPAPAPPPARTYTVRAGDTLSGIAAKYWEPFITWQSIYNLNRGIIGPNPNLIRPGQILAIG